MARTLRRWQMISLFARLSVFCGWLNGIYLLIDAMGNPEDKEDEIMPN